MILNIFKKKIRDNQSIATRLSDILNQHPNNLQIIIYIQEQVLFQIMPAKNFIQKGLAVSNPDDFVEIHFFNKNKTLTFDKLGKFKNSDLEKEFFYYEEPKGNFNYLKVLGQNPTEIEKQIYVNFNEIYELDDLSEISIDYVDY